MAKNAKTNKGEVNQLSPLLDNTNQQLVNIDAERSLLGLLIVNNNVFEEINDIITANNFYYQQHQYTFEIVKSLLDKSQVADVVTITQFASYNPKYSEINFDFVLSLVNSVINTVSYKEYAQLIYDLYLKRQVLILQENISGLLKSNSNFTEIIDNIEAEIFNLSENGKIDNSVQTFDTALQKSLQAIQTARSYKDGISGVDTGLVDLNKKLGGLQKSDLIILAGRPAMGKTALATNIAFNAANKYIHSKGHPGAPVVIFSLEMSAEQIASRMLSTYTGISSDALRKGQLTDNQFLELSNSIQTFKNTPIYIDDTPALTISQIRTRCRKLKRQNNIGFIVIDYIQLIGSEKTTDNRAVEVGLITRGLKAIAKEINVPILALSQLSRAVESREDKTPMLSDLRESGSIEQDADVVSFIFRAEYYKEREEPKMANKDESQEQFTKRYEKWKVELENVKNKATLVIAKNRHGSIGNIDLAFDPARTYFYNLDKTYTNNN